METLIDTLTQWLTANPGVIVLVLFALVMIGIVQLLAEQLAWTRAWARRNDPRPVDLTQFTIK